MIVETIVLPIVQKVLTSYVTSVMTKRSTEKTRADLVNAVREELRSVAGIRDEVKALHAAVTELDVVVKADRNLGWRSDDDALVIRPPRSVLPRSLSVDDALQALQKSVAERRQELGLGRESDPPEPAEGQRPVGAVDDDAELVPSGTPSPRPPDAPEPSAWQKRVLSLSEETRRERRQRFREDR